MWWGGGFAGLAVLGYNRPMECETCDDTGWTCEVHPNRPWNGQNACTLADLPTDQFDAIISNNVFEHIFDIVGTLEECRRFMPDKNNRLHIFTDPLFYSSVGSHLPIDPWEHLRIDEDEMKQKLPPDANWDQYKNGLNRMTITSFLDSVRRAGMAVEHLSVVPDRNRELYLNFNRDMRVAPMDALLEGISCTLAFPENL